MRGGGRKEEGSEGYYDCGEGEGCCGARLAASASPAALRWGKRCDGCECVWAGGAAAGG